jgi:hypothetical protein
MRKNELLLANTFDALISKLEAFGSQIKHLVTTADQQNPAAKFNAFVGEIIQELDPPAERGDGHLAPATEMEFFLRMHGHESLQDLFSEIRVDEAAGKCEDAHWYGKEAFKKMLDGKIETPAAEMANGNEIER